jgi:hypothetical protein
LRLLTLIALSLLTLNSSLYATEKPFVGWWTQTELKRCFDAVKKGTQITIGNETLIFNKGLLYSLFLSASRTDEVKDVYGVQVQRRLDQAKTFYCAVFEDNEFKPKAVK